MIEQTIEVERMEHVISVFGSFDQNLLIIENELGVKVMNRDDKIHVCGEAEDVMLAEKAINGLLTLAAKGENIDAQNVRYILKLVREGRETKIGELAGDVVCITAKGKPIKPKTLGQKAYCDAIEKNTITLGVGPAGTGKTYLAVAAAVAAFRAEKVNRIILTRPRGGGGRKAGLSPRRPAAEGGSVPAPAVRRAVRHAGRGYLPEVSGAQETSRWRRWRTCAAARWTTASSFWTRPRTPRPSR
jgi:phosphate starvation-inducible PhoH-like protein